MREFRRIFWNPAHLILLAALLVLSAAAFYFRQWERWEPWAAAPRQVGQAYAKLMAPYQDMEMDEGLAKAEEDTAVYSALSLLLAVRGEEDYERIRANYAAIYPELVESVEQGKWDDENISALLAAAQYMKEQIAGLSDYPGYLQQIQDNAQNLKTSSLFSQPGSFRYRNIQKTQQDYAVMDPARLTVSPILSGDAYLEDSPILAVSGLVYLLFLCYFMFAERRGAMWETAYAAPAGRGKLACKRVVILAAASFCFVFLYSAVRLLFSLFLYGGLHPGVSIQEISDWQAVPLSFTMGTFILVQFLLRWMGLWILGLLTIGICSWFSNQNLAFVVILAILALELILHRQLSDASFFVWLKYINTSILLNTDLLLAKYLNLPLGSIPIGLSVAAGVFMVLLGLASFFVFLAGMVWKRPAVPFRPWERVCVWIRTRLPWKLHSAFPLLTELKKAFLWKRGIAVALLYVLVTVVLTRPVRLYDAEKDSALNLYYAETEGPLETERISSYMEGAQAWIDDGIKALDEAAQQLENGTIGELEYTRQVILWESLPARAEALEEFRQDMAYLRDSGQGQEGQTVHRQAYVVNPFGYRWILGERSNWLKLVLFCLQAAGILYIQVLMASYDKQSGMEELLLAAPKGRRPRFRRKMGAGLIHAVFLWALGWLCLIRVVYLSGGTLHFLQAPITSFSFLREASLTGGFWDICPIGVYVGFWVLLHLAVLLGMVVIVTFCCRPWQKKKKA